MVDLVGRAPEQRILRKARESPEAELIAIYGRRRVGKTFLIREFFGRDICFELTGAYGVKLSDQLHSFSAALADAGGTIATTSPPTSWREAFQQLLTHLRSLPRRRRKRVVFFDEIPWLASRRSGFLQALEHFWNSWAVKQEWLAVVVCGSAASWMIQRILRARGGLHNRVTRRIRLLPFTLEETRTYLLSRKIQLGDYQTIELYMALGGIAHYLKETESGESAAQNIERICFEKEGLLRDEFPNLYHSLFEHADRHESVVRALAKKQKGLTRSELIVAADLQTGGATTVLLKELEESGFIMRTGYHGLNSKNTAYRLADEYSLFYLKWIEKHRSSARNAWLNKRSSPSWRAWSGYAFEGICLKHVPALKRALGIEAVETTESVWQHRPAEEGDTGAQIDLLIDRNDRCINLCEIKFSEGEFVIDKRYAADLRKKVETFRRVTQTRKTVLLTLVTTFGVRANRYRDELVDQELDMSALFARG